MSLPVYPQYVEHTDAWLAKLPSHWRSSSLKWISKRFAGGTPDKARHEYWTDGDIPWLNSGAVNDPMIAEASAYITQEAYESSSAKWIPAGSLLMALAGQGKTKGTVAQLTFEATCNQSMAAIVPSDEVEVRYLYWWLTKNYQNIRNMAGGDLRDGLNLELLGQIPCPLPPFREQGTIGAFLDRETAKIDALIAEQGKLLALLAEKRQATISRAVTRGLDPNVPMKDSGIPWLEAVPAHWSETRVSSVGSFRQGKAHEPFVDDEGQFICVNSRFVSTGGASRKFCTQNLTPALRDDVLMVMSDLPNGRALAKAFIVPDDEPYAVNQRVCALTFFAALPKFMYYLLDRNPHFLAEDDGMNQTHLTNSSFTQMKVFLPPQVEQIAIAGYLDAKIEVFDALTHEAMRGIELLKERRSALISAAVTGKIDLRGALPSREAA